MTTQSGVTVFDADRCDDSYRLYSSRDTEVAHLVDTDGSEVHRWTYEQGETWHYAEMLSDGHLLALIKETAVLSQSEQGYSGMLLELDWDSNLVWQAQVPIHHDFERLPNGNTLVLCRERAANSEVCPGDCTSDYIAELTMANEVVWKWHADEHVCEMAAIVDIALPLNARDILHTNTIESLSGGPAAEKDSRFSAGNILFSCRQVSTIGVIDRQTGRVVWAWGPGVVHLQHMPTMLPCGHMLVYDNGCASERSRVLEIDPVTETIVWEYQADPPGAFYSPTRGSNQRLANGNTFIADSDSGRLFEVTPAGEIVWEFLNPDLCSNGERMHLYRAMCYPRELVDSLA